MVASVIASLLLWAFANKGFEGATREKMKLSLFGSSFYLILTVGLFVLLLNPPPAGPYDDYFMRDMGLMFGIIVTFVAGLTSFFVTTIPLKQK